MFVLCHPAVLSSHSSINRISQWKEEGYGDFMHGALWIFATHHRVNLGGPMGSVICAVQARCMCHGKAICDMRRYERGGSGAKDGDLEIKHLVPPMRIHLPLD